MYRYGYTPHDEGDGVMLTSRLDGRLAVAVREQLPRDHQDDADDLDDGRTEPHIDNSGFELPVLTSPRKHDEDRICNHNLNAQQPQKFPWRTFA